MPSCLSVSPVGSGRYENGTLDQWAAGDRVPPWTQVRGVLLDVLLGLGHLHAHGVIHGDVKPANVLVDGRERGRLADFDISIDSKNRTSAARVLRKSTVVATAQGMTTDFAAPELRSSGQATRHTDMFAYGKTVDGVSAQCEPGDAVGDAAGARGAAGLRDRARGQAAVLVGALTAQSPHDRPSAEGATRHAFFTILAEARQRLSKTCVLCATEGRDAIKDAAAGAECCEAHFHCSSCVADLASKFMDVANLQELKEREGRLACSRFARGCNSGFADQDLARLLPVDVFKRYLEAQAVAVEACRRCSICLEDKAQGLECGEQHFICVDCAPREVERILDQIEEEPGALARHREHGGRIECVEPGCRALYAETLLARNVPEDVFRRYRGAQDAAVEQRLFEQLQGQFQEQLAAARAAFDGSKARAAQDAAAAAATAEFMRRQFPNAVQCPQCGAGPVIPENCYDLQAHHGERLGRGGRVSNACPSCGFFGRERGCWARWDGQMR